MHLGWIGPMGFAGKRKLAQGLQGFQQLAEGFCSSRQQLLDAAELLAPQDPVSAEGVTWVVSRGVMWGVVGSGV